MRLGMLTKSEQLERVLRGSDFVARDVLRSLRERGWAGDRNMKNVATKMYSTNRATIRVLPDWENRQYLVTGEYYSGGQNILATCSACIKTPTSWDKVDAAMDKFLEEAEASIKQSFPARSIGTRNDGSASSISKLKSPRM